MQFLSHISLIFSSLNFIKTEKIEESSHPYEPNQYFKVSRHKLFIVPFLFTYRIGSTQVVSHSFSAQKFTSSTRQMRQFNTNATVQQRMSVQLTRVRILSQVQVRDQSSPPGLGQRHFNTQTYGPHPKKPDDFFVVLRYVESTVFMCSTDAFVFN